MRISDWSSDVCSSDLGMLGPMRQQQALPEARLSELETRWAEASLHEAADANVLADRWETLPKPLKSAPRVVIAYAHRAAAPPSDDASARRLQPAPASRLDQLHTAPPRPPPLPRPSPPPRHPTTRRPDQ